VDPAAAMLPGAARHALASAFRVHSQTGNLSAVRYNIAPVGQHYVCAAEQNGGVDSRKSRSECNRTSWTREALL
jgi:hypothetical protein